MDLIGKIFTLWLVMLLLEVFIYYLYLSIINLSIRTVYYILCLIYRQIKLHDFQIIPYKNYHFNAYIERITILVSLYNFKNIQNRSA